MVKSFNLTSHLHDVPNLFIISNNENGQKKKKKIWFGPVRPGSRNFNQDGNNKPGEEVKISRRVLTIGEKGGEVKLTTWSSSKFKST